MKLFLVEGVVFRTYFDKAEERIDDTRLVMAEDGYTAKLKYENWWEDQSEDQAISYYAYGNQAKEVIE
jgi:hypothetical protein